MWAPAIVLVLVLFGMQSGLPSLGEPDAELTRLFTPGGLAIPPGTYVVYRSPKTLADLAAALKACDPSPAPGAWDIQRPEPLDAFPAYGQHDRSRLARLFNGRRVTLTRGSLLVDGRRVAFVLIAPYPDPTLSAIVDRGTMVIVFNVPGRGTPPRGP
jgi:hypothetical protein